MLLPQEARRPSRLSGPAPRAHRRSRGPVSAPPKVVARLVNAAGDLEQAVLRAGRSIVEPAPSPPPAENSAGSRSYAAGGILADTLPSRTDLTDVELEHVLMLAWTAEWIAHVRHALGGLAAPLAQVRALAARPWWQ